MEQSRESTPYVRFEVEKVIGISSDGNYQVQWAPAWVSKFHLVGCEHLIQEFLQRQSEKADELHMQVETQLSSFTSNESTSCQTEVGSPQFDDTSAKFEQISNGDDEKVDLPTLGLESVVNQRKVDGGEYCHSMADGNHKESNNRQDLLDAVTFHIKVESEEVNEVHEMIYPSISLPSETYSQPNIYQGYSDRIQTTSPNLAIKIPRIKENRLEHHREDNDMSLPISAKIFVCSFCSQHFTTKSQMKTHVRTHTGERPFECKFCGKRFVQRGHLLNHLSTHSNDKPFVCHCGKEFTRKDSLGRHARSHAEVMIVEKDVHQDGVTSGNG